MRSPTRRPWISKTSIEALPAVGRTKRTRVRSPKGCWPDNAKARREAPSPSTATAPASRRHKPSPRAAYKVEPLTSKLWMKTPMKSSSFCHVAPPSSLSSTTANVNVLKAPTKHEHSDAKAVQVRGPKPTPVRAHGSSPAALRKTPAFEPTTQLVPFHLPVNPEAPGWRPTLSRLEVDQSASPESLKKTWPF